MKVIFFSTNFLIGIFFITMISCAAKPEFALEPKIEYVSLTSNEIIDKNNVDITINLTFEDGDGNLGKNPEVDNLLCNPALICDLTSDSSCFRDPFFSAYLINNTSGCVSHFIELPDFEPNGKIKAVSGELFLKLPPVVLCSDCNCERDSIQYRVVVRDLDGNLSNEVLTDFIYINCN